MMQQKCLVELKGCVMIYSYHRGSKPLLAYSKGVEFLDKRVVFGDGINLIIGKNGSGKSALLSSLKRLMLVDGHGHMKMNGLGDIGHMFWEGKSFSDQVRHGGEAAFCDKKYDTGYFDYDNLAESMSSIYTQERSSSGESQLRHLSAMWDRIAFARDVSDAVCDFKSRCSSHDAEMADAWHRWFESGIVEDKKRMTIILDEPTGNMDVPFKMEFWDVVRDSDGVQFIIATHDLYPLSIPGVNVIETESGYLELLAKYFPKPIILRSETADGGTRSLEQGSNNGQTN